MDIRSLLNACDFKCDVCEKTNPLCKDINYLNSKDKALTYKHKIYKDKRGYENSKSVEPDLIFELFVADNINLSPLKILNKYNYQWDENYKFSTTQIQKVNRIKRKLKSLQPISSISYVQAYLQNTDMKSFNVNELDIYIDAIKYLSITKPFKLSFRSNPHKSTTITCNWFELSQFLISNPNTYMGNDIYFFASFCKGDNKKRALCNRLFVDLGCEEAFSIADLDYILHNIQIPNYTKDEFFNHLRLINTFKNK